MSGINLDGRTYIPFRGSEAPTLGVELEFQIVDPDTWNLRSGARTIMDHLGDDHPHIKPELTQSTVEVITGICKSVAEARADLAASIETLYEIGDAEQFTLSAAGTHPFGKWNEQEIYPNERYQALVDRIQWGARRLTIYGMHVHVGVRSGERAIAIGNALTTYLPHLLALSASSPYVEAEDSGLASCRVKIFEVMPTAGIPYRLANYSEFQSYMNALLRAGAIESIREIWWDVRPHPAFGTIEVRICDMPSTLTEVSALAALVQCLVVYLDRLYEHGALPVLLHPWIVRENKWRATRFGLDAQVIVENDGNQSALRDEIDRLVQTLEPVAARLDCLEELRLVHALVATGNSCVRQRDCFGRRGTLPHVVADLAERLRGDVHTGPPVVR